ncbi:MAG: asparagine synthase (glutamine-hydrolyzing) [Acidimicrobiales bacterium]|nr:asparagine synthase (glutamine-hydrolyzing) [Acidimicrobiales bacterium]
MCGIAGLLRGGGRPADPAALAAMRTALAHRGPDQQGEVVDGPLGLAAARLAVVDPGPSGRQPFTGDRFALAFNGELYNTAELRARLRRDGVAFDGRSDTEVLFHALARWGVDATLPRLEGMFAFAFADLARGAVWLARDRLGIKPLVWAEHDGDLVFASEAKALAAVRPLAPDPVQAVFAVAGRVERSAHRTAFLDVEQVPPGHLLTAEAGRRPRLTAWTGLADLVDEGLHAELDGLDDRGLADRLDEAVRASTARVADCDAPLGLFVSGGVDSALLAAVLPSRASHPAFAADVGGDRSELPAALEVADTLGLDLTPVPFPAPALLDDWAVATWHAEAPVVTHVNGLPFRRLAQAAHERGVKAVLTGEGADELFSGYATAAGAPLARRARAARQVAWRVAGRLPGPVGGALRRRAVSQADFLVDLAGDFGAARRLDEGREAFSFLGDRGAEPAAETLVWLGDHLPTLLRRNDALGMAASVEARFPYLDDAVVRLGVNAPASAKVSVQGRLGDPRHPFVRDKALLRRVAGRHLPEAVARRTKSGFPVHGHDRIRTTPGFWADGYVVDLLGLSAGAVDHLVERTDPYLAAKLASVEVFGRLFGWGQSVDVVRAHVRSGARCTEL